MLTLYIYLLYFFSMFQCHVYNRQVETLCLLLHTRYSFKALKYGFYSILVLNVSTFYKTGNVIAM